MTTNQKIWLVAINMGYGHQRTADNLKHLAFEGAIINANDYPGIPPQERENWEKSRKFYEFISNFKRIPLLGSVVFWVFDAFQKIPRFYPRRDLSGQNLASRRIYLSFKSGLGRDLIERLKKRNLSIVSTFFTPAFMAEYYGYPGEIFCVICDADISRTWAPANPGRSGIKYFAPTERVVERLKLYGVKPENIFLTGYPLPLENIGSEKMEILKEDQRRRILNLDPQKKYLAKYKTLIEENLGELPESSGRVPTMMFSIGGAGAQKEIAALFLKSLAVKIKERKIRVILSAGIKDEAREYFMDNIRKIGLENYLGEGVEIIFAGDMKSYFRDFNSALRRTDILWTKPSELSFFSALGLPIIIAPRIGSQEEFNKRWLLKSGFGILQENPDFAAEWLFEWLEKGYLAEFSMNGFMRGDALGAYKIKEIINCF